MERDDFLKRIETNLEAARFAGDDAIARDIEEFEAELGRRVPNSDASLNPTHGIVENGSNPSTHPLRRGGWTRSMVDPTLRSAEEFTVTTGREEVVLD